MGYLKSKARSVTSERVNTMFFKYHILVTMTVQWRSDKKPPSDTR